VKATTIVISATWYGDGNFQECKQEISAFVYGDFAVYRSIEGGIIMGPGKWTLTHIPSGLACRCHIYKNRAIKAAAAASKCPEKWEGEK
jgi:hypothetical protein